MCIASMRVSRDSLVSTQVQSHALMRRGFGTSVPFICACSDSAMPLLSCTCLRNSSNGACLPSCCFLLNITACTAAKMGGRTFESKVPFATTSFQKGGWAYFQLTLMVAVRCVLP